MRSTPHTPEPPVALFALKLYALAAMVVDHADWLVLDGALGFHDTWGRAVFPIFAYLVALNLARADLGHMLRVVAPRMVLFGLLASPFYVPLAGWLPLNVLFTLAAAVTIAAVSRYSMVAAIAIFIVAGVVVDYVWFGLAAILLPWWMFRRGIPGRMLVAAAAVIPVNGSLWSLAVFLPVLLAIVLATMFPGNPPRLKWVFYAAYPAHLALLWVIGMLG